jgi:hypothetical protein
MDTNSSELDDRSSASNGPPRILCVLGVPRTGTNHLCSVLSNIPEIESRFEIFHPVRSYSMRPDELMALSRLTQTVFDPSSTDPEAVRTIRANPGLTLECILSSMKPPKRLLSFKVFGHHLTAEEVGNTIISRSDAIIAFVRRRPIDTYISLMKAATLGKWSQVNTTDLKVKIDATEFVNWWQQAVDWYHCLEAACWTHGKPLNHLDYARDIDVAPEHLTQRVITLLAKNGVADLTTPDLRRFEGIQRQDCTEAVEQRVSNWLEFYDQLVAMGAKEKAFDPIPQFKPY